MKILLAILLTATAWGAAPTLVTITDTIRRPGGEVWVGNRAEGRG